MTTNPATNLPELPNGLFFRVDKSENKYSGFDYTISVIERVERRLKHSLSDIVFYYWARFQRAPKTEAYEVYLGTEPIVYTETAPYGTRIAAQEAADARSIKEGVEWGVTDKLLEAATSSSPATYYSVLYTHDLTDASIKASAERLVTGVLKKIMVAEAEKAKHDKYLGDYPPKKIG